MNKLGILSLFCISLALQDGTSNQNISIFEDDSILSALIFFAKDKHTMANAMRSNKTMQKIVQKNDTIANQVESQALRKLRVVALHIIVIISEF